MAELLHLYIRPRRVRLFSGGQRGPCPYCSQMYTVRTASVHFVPCCYCQDLTHPGCRH